jgi:hypothetical protein
VCHTAIGKKAQTDGHKKMKSIHLMEKGYEKWAKLLKELIKKRDLRFDSII